MADALLGLASLLAAALLAVGGWLAARGVRRPTRGSAPAPRPERIEQIEDEADARMEHGEPGPDEAAELLGEAERWDRRR